MLNLGENQLKIHLPGVHGLHTIDLYDMVFIIIYAQSV